MSENTEESVGPLDGEPDVEKVYTQDETRLYRQRAILAYLDGLSFQLVVEKDPTPVENEDGKLLGFAVVWRLNGRLAADIAIDYATPERLAAQTREGVRHYARIVGTVRRVRESPYLELSARVTQVQRITINKIVLAVARPDDTRLLPFGELVL